MFLVVAVVFCTFTVRKNLKEKRAAEAKGEVFDTAEEEGLAKALGGCIYAFIKKRPCA